MFFFAAQFAVFALLDFGNGEPARLAAIGLEALLLAGFVLWRFDPQGGSWPGPQACVHAMLAAATLALSFFDRLGIQVGITFALLHVVDKTAGPLPEEGWPPEPDPPDDALWPGPSPAKTGVVAFLSSFFVCLAPGLETLLMVGLLLVALMVLRGFAVAHHANWRPMPIWRPGLLQLYGPMVCYAVFVIGLYGDPTLQRGLIVLVFPYLLLAASNLGENIGRRWMKYREGQ